MKYLFTTLLLIICFNSKSQTIITEGPYLSSSAVTIPKKSFQIESQFTVELNVAIWTYERQHFEIPSLLFRYGLFKKLELRATGSFNLIRNNLGSFPAIYGINNVGLGAKYELLNRPEGKTQMAIIGHFNFLNQNSPWRGVRFDYVLNHNFNDKHSLGFNVNVSDNWKSNNNPDQFTGFRSSLIYKYRPIKNLTFFGEVYEEGPTNYFNILVVDMIGFNSGFLYSIGKNIQLDCSFGMYLDIYPDIYTNQTFLEVYEYNGSIGFNILLNSKKK